MVNVNIPENADWVLIGVGTAQTGQPYIDVPTLAHAIVHSIRPRPLLPALAGKVRPPRRFIICPRGNIDRYGNEIWAEYFIAEAIRRAGCVVKTMRLPDGVQTVADAERPLSQWVIDAPTDGNRVAERAQRAIDNARERRGASRKSSKREAALDFLERYRPQAITVEIVECAIAEGINERTLRRVFAEWRTANPHIPGSTVDDEEERARRAEYEADRDRREAEEADRREAIWRATREVEERMLDDCVAYLQEAKLRIVHRGLREQLRERGCEHHNQIRQALQRAGLGGLRWASEAEEVCADWLRQEAPARGWKVLREVSQEEARERGWDWLVVCEAWTRILQWPTLTRWPLPVVRDDFRLRWEGEEEGEPIPF